MSERSNGAQSMIDELARKHGVSSDAVTALLEALIAGHGNQAQFRHPELGGMGQWSSGGMIMIGDMFNHGLKAKVDALARDLSAGVRDGSLTAVEPDTNRSALDSFALGWPGELGRSSSSGAQNGMRYAVFPETRRLAVERDGIVSVYDTDTHRITGVSQQQSGGQSLCFTSPDGAVRIEELRRVDTANAKEPASVIEPAARYSAPAQPTCERKADQTDSAASGDDVFAKIERLADLKQRGIISSDDFETKKVELLARV